MPYTFDNISNPLVDAGKNRGDMPAVILGAITHSVAVWCKIDPLKYHIGDDYTLRHYSKISEIDVYMPLVQFKKLKKLKIGKFPETKGKKPDDKMLYSILIPSVGKIEFHTQSRNTAVPSPKFNHGTLKRTLIPDEAGNLCMGPDTYIKFCVEGGTARDQKNMEILYNGLSDGKFVFGLDADVVKKLIRKLKKIIES